MLLHLPSLGIPREAPQSLIPFLAGSRSLGWGWDGCPAVALWDGVSIVPSSTKQVFFWIQVPIWNGHQGVQGWPPIWWGPFTACRLLSPGLIWPSRSICEDGYWALGLWAVIEVVPTSRILTGLMLVWACRVVGSLENSGRCWEGSQNLKDPRGRSRRSRECSGGSGRLCQRQCHSLMPSSERVISLLLLPDLLGPPWLPLALRLGQLYIRIK